MKQYVNIKYNSCVSKESSALFFLVVLFVLQMIAGVKRNIIIQFNSHIGWRSRYQKLQASMIFAHLF